MKDPRPRSTPKSDESSVVISLQELVRLERSRVEDEAREKSQREARAEAERLAEAERKIELDRAQQARAEERTHEAELRRRMDDAQIEAAKLAELENRKLAQQQRLHLERLAAEERHAREMATLQAAKQKRFPTGLVAGIGAAIAAIAVAAIVTFSSKPPVTVVDGSADAQRAEERRAAEQRAEKQDQEIRDLLKKVEDLKNQPPPPVATATSSTAPKPKLPTKPPVVKKEEGCTLEVAGVPMCAKKQP
jgi:siroheme synthase